MKSFDWKYQMKYLKLFIFCKFNQSNYNLTSWNKTNKQTNKQRAISSYNRGGKKKGEIETKQTSLKCWSSILHLLLLSYNWHWNEKKKRKKGNEENGNETKILHSMLINNVT